MTVVAIVDFKTMTIPNVFVGIAFIFGLLSPQPTVTEKLIGVFIISVPMILLNLLVGEAFGGGDIKFMAASGLFLGWKLELTTFFIAVLVGGVYAIYLIICKKEEKYIAFGPYLCVGMMVSLLWGKSNNSLVFNLDKEIKWKNFIKIRK
ncbi:Leader peptidase (Prepilin peptidase) [Lachnospiraceae bacterium TWA4]|nr:Leader peptidase (Prepilin peptidase) [Lachnospiraceae bacterium TWA4]